MKQFIILLLLSFFSLFPLFHQGFFVTDDGDWMVIRFSAFHQTLADGQFPLRFLGRLNHEYGYPVATFLYPGFLYFAEPFHLIGFGFVDSIKIVFGLSLLGSSVFCYLWLCRFFDKTAAVIGALFYVYTPYHLFDVYTRGSVGEALALAVVPFILWQWERKSVFWSAIGLGVLLLSHNILAALFFMFLICYVGFDIFLAKRKKSLLLTSLFLILFGFGLSAFFWIPALFELQYTAFSETQISDWEKYFADLSLIGYATVAVFIGTGILFVQKKLSIKKHRLTISLFFIGVLALFFATSGSSFFWNVLPVQFIQFPYRVLSVVLICVAFLAAATLSLLQGKKKLIVGVVFVSLLFISVYPFAKPRAYTDRGDAYYATNMDTTTVHDEYMPVWVKEKPSGRPVEKVHIVKGEGEITDVVVTNKQVNFSLNSEENTRVQINTVYWSGWEAFVDGKEVEIMYTNPQGVIQLTIPQGIHTVVVSFGETPIRLFSDILSVISFGLLMILLFIRRKKR